MNLFKVHKMTWKPSKGVSQSTIQAFMRCKREGLLRYGFGVDNRQPKFAADWGTAFHSLLEDWHKANCPENIKQIWDKFEEQMYSINNNPMVACNQDIEVMLAELYAVFSGYVYYYFHNDSQLLFTNPEAYFRHKHKGTVLTGKIDSVFERQGKVWIMETKTKSRIAKDLDMLLTFDLQIYWYAFMWKKITGVLPEGILYDIVKKPSLKKTSTLDAFVDKINNDVFKRLDEYYQRIEIAIMEEEFNELSEELETMADSVILDLKKASRLYKANEFDKLAKEFPRNSTSCLRHYTCSFAGLCSQENLSNFVWGDEQ